MVYYFQLQSRRLIRGLAEFGVNPFLGCLLAAAGFVLLSNLIFTRLSYPEFAYPALPLALIWLNYNPEKRTFLQQTFGKQKYLQLRLLENTLFILPFLLFLSFKGYFSHSAATLSIGLLIALLPGRAAARVVIPSPFSGYPFEFTVGFRKTYGLLALFFALTIISLFVGNVALGLFGLAAAILVCMNFYADAEPLFYVFTHAQSADAFLITKIKIAVWYSSCIILPFIIPLLVMFPGKVYLIVPVGLLGLLYIILGLLGKYSDYPHQIKLPQMLKLTAGLLFPPALLFLIPHLYIRSRRKLEIYLK